MRVLSSRGTGTLLIGVLLACHSVGAPQGAKETTAKAFVFLEEGTVLVAELADTPAKLQLGFMYREKVGRDDAMLFLFPISDFHSIWMKNCRVPLDIIWIRDDGKVVHLEESLPPCEPDRLCPSRRPLQKARYVLELAAGEAQRRGIRMGTQLTLVLESDESTSD